MSATSLILSSLLQAIHAVMLPHVYVSKVPKVSKLLCPVKVQTRYNVCCAFQPLCPFIAIGSGMSTNSIDVFASQGNSAYTPPLAAVSLGL